MNYREKMRKAIECPQFGNEAYGEWGILNLEQRKYIKRLLDELDSADNCVKRLYLKNRKQKEVIDKSIDFIENGDLLYLATKNSIVYRNNIEIRAVADRLNDLLQILEDKEVE